MTHYNQTFQNYKKQSKMDNSSNLQLSNWLPLESNTEILNNYLGVLGISQDLVSFSEVVSLDKESLIFIPQPIVGAIFVYPDSKQINNYFFSQGDKMFQKQVPKEVYYMKQIAENACGTISLLHSLINIIGEYPFILQEDSFVSQFLNDTNLMNPVERAEYLNDCKTMVKKNDGTKKSLKDAHKDAVEEAGQVDEKTKVYHHFISFVWKNGLVIELDGRKKEPIIYCECPSDEFMGKVMEICQEHYIKHDEDGQFNLMALSIG